MKIYKFIYSIHISICAARINIVPINSIQGKVFLVTMKNDHEYYYYMYRKK